MMKHLISSDLDGGASSSPTRSWDKSESEKEEVDKTNIFGGSDAYDATIDNRGESDGTINCHEYVDLGLSVKWATCNIGASRSEGYGYFFAWCEIHPKRKYSKKNSTAFGKNGYYEDISGDSSLDAATANWGGTWRLPRAGEIQELIDECTWEWTAKNGKKGYEVISKVNGKSIFLPAAGRRLGSSLDRAGSYGNYWSSTPRTPGTSYAYCLVFFDSGIVRRDYCYRYFGLRVRPVSE